MLMLYGCIYSSTLVFVFFSVPFKIENIEMFFMAYYTESFVVCITVNYFATVQKQCIMYCVTILFIV